MICFCRMGTHCIQSDDPVVMLHVQSMRTKTGQSEGNELCPPGGAKLRKTYIGKVSSLYVVAGFDRNWCKLLKVLHSFFLFSFSSSNTDVRLLQYILILVRYLVSLTLHNHCRQSTPWDRWVVHYSIPLSLPTHPVPLTHQSLYS